MSLFGREYTIFVAPHTTALLAYLISTRYICQVEDITANLIGDTNTPAKRFIVLVEYIYNEETKKHEFLDVKAPGAILDRINEGLLKHLMITRNKRKGTELIENGVVFAKERGVKRKRTQ